MLSFIMVVFLNIFLSLNLHELSDEEIKNKIIEKSRKEYEGNCPCPDDTDKNGKSCGNRSAYSRSGGKEPRCYPEDVTPEDIIKYRNQNTNNSGSRT